MRTLGSYEAVEELSRTAFGAVYSARAVGTQEAPAHFIKVFAPPAMSDAERLADLQTENFLAAARLQQKAAEASRFWAPVHEIGTAAEGAYYVSSLYPISARRLVMGKVKLTDADLHALISAIVQGLKDLRASCAQAHGNIKLTTVLLPRGGEAAYGQAVLAEPLLPHKAAAVTEAADLAAIAKLVHHLVTHRPFSDAGGWPIPAGAEWSRLGSGGDDWRELCNTLLNPNPDAAVGIDALSEMLEKLKPRRPIVSGKMRVAAAVLALLAGIGYGLYAHYAPYFRYSTADWTQLAGAYSGWLRVLDTYQSYPRLNAAVQRDPELVAIVRELKGSGIVFDTKEILGTRDYGYDELKEQFPTTAEGRRRTRVAVEFMPIVQERLKQWQAIRLAEQVGQRCETIAPAVASVLSGLIEQASTDPSSGSSDPELFANTLAELAALAPALTTIDKDLAAVEEIEESLASQRIGTDRQVFADLPERVTATYRGSAPAASVPQFRSRLDEVKGALDTINRDWKALSPRLTTIHDPDDVVLALVPAFVDDALYGDRSPSMGATLPPLAERVQKLNAGFAQPPWSELHARATDWKAGGIDKVEFRKDEPYTNLRIDDPRGQLSAWAMRAGMYLKLPAAEDPRTALPARFAQLDEALKRLDADYPAPTPVPEENLALKKEADAWRTGLSSLQNMKWLGGWREEIDKGARSAQADLDGLLARIEQARVVRADVRDAFIARVRGRGAQFGHGLLRQQWQTLQAQWLKDEAKWKRDERALRPPVFRALQTSVDQAEARLAAIETALPRGVGLNLGPQAPAWGAPLIAELEKLAVGEYETAIAAGILRSDWSNLAADRFPDQWAPARDKYLAWRTEAGRLVEDLNLIEALLDGGYGLETAVNEAYARATRSSQWQAAAKLVQPLVDRIARLGNPGDARADLITAAKGDDASLAVAAWRRLKTPDWPGNLAELDEELAIQKHLEDRVNAAKSKLSAAEKHLQPLRTALAAERRARRQAAWRRLAEEVDHGEQSRQQLDALLAKMPACDVAFPPGAELPLKPATLFNIALYRLRQDVRQYAPGAQDGQATARLEQFKKEIPESLRSQQELLDLVSRLEKAAEPVADQQVLIAQDGPPASPVKTMTWKPEDGGDEDVRTYKWTYNRQSHTLVFRRLKEPPGVAADPVFLCTTEVSLGLFMQVIEAAAATQKRTDRLDFAGLHYDNFGRGPHVWRAAGSGILPTSSWLSFVEVAFEDRVYAHALGDVDKPLARQGGRVMPMQRISPAAAMYFSHLMGCRLPTSGEFESARKMQPAAAAVAGPTPPNLRDRAWEAQHQHISEIVDREGDAVRAQAPWPDMGTFETTTTKTRLGADAQAVQGAADDGFLWFRPVQTDETFCNLIGNVAEYLWDDARLLEPSPQIKMLSDFREIVAKHGRGNLYVAGASAISAPELGSGRHEVANFNNGFADVGFRLAFTVPSRTIVDRMRIVADKQKYMVVAASGSVDSARPR